MGFRFLVERSEVDNCPIETLGELPPVGLEELEKTGGGEVGRNAGPGHEIA
jgi:hypothetical protein